MLTFHSPISNFSGITSTPIILVAPQSLAPSATYVPKYISISLFFQQGVRFEIPDIRDNITEKSLNHTANPIDPSPNMTTVDPASTFAVLQAAPTPTILKLQ